MEDLIDFSIRLRAGTLEKPHDPSLAVGHVIKIRAVACVESAVGKPLSEIRTPEEIAAAFDALAEHHRIMAPDLLHALWRKRRLEPEHLRRVILDVWKFTDFPRFGCPPAAWRAMFRLTGFLSDGTPKPKRPITLYRGCTPEGRRGMSWTLHRFQAETFANYWWDHQQADRVGHVYKARVDPSRILAVVPDRKEKLPRIELRADGRVVKHPDDSIEILVKPEYEFIIDARNLKVTLVERWPKRFAREIRDGLRDRDDLARALRDVTAV